MRKTGCKARQESDQMCCGQCGLAWDVNDPEPPKCRDRKWHDRQRGFAALKRIKEMLK